MAQFAKMFYGFSDEKLKTVGVTGTNGKTTVAAYVRSLLTLLGLPAGSIGTTGIWASTHKLSYKKARLLHLNQPIFTKFSMTSLSSETKRR